MGVEKVLVPDPPEGFDTQSEVKCPNKKCPRTIVPVFVVHEDEGILEYSGNCSSCGGEYHLSLMKEPIR